MATNFRTIRVELTDGQKLTATHDAKGGVILTGDNGTVLMFGASDPIDAMDVDNCLPMVVTCELAAAGEGQQYPNYLDWLEYIGEEPDEDNRAEFLRCQDLARLFRYACSGNPFDFWSAFMEKYNV